MIEITYAPIRKTYAEYAVAYSKTMDLLLKRKRLLEFNGGEALEWKKLADEFMAEDGRANHAYCMIRYRSLFYEFPLDKMPVEDIIRL